jgi:hydrogenase maturation protein HypF
MSCKFHNTIADIILKTSIALSRKFKTKQIVLSGGVFQNKYLVSKAIEILVAAGFKVYTHSNISTNDSGIPFGQIAIAEARLRCV